MVHRTLLLIALLAATGCGASAEEVRRANDGEECPAGTRDLRPRDVLPDVPAGLSLGPADPRDAQRYRVPFERELGERLRSVRIGVVTARGEDYGTALLVVNGTERMGDPRDVLRGAEASNRPGVNPEEYTIAGRPGMISVESDGAIAAVAISTCAMLMLSGPDTPTVKRIAAHIRQPE